MNEHSEMHLKGKGYKLQMQHIHLRIYVAAILSVGILFAFAFLYGRISIWAEWLLIAAFAVLGLSPLLGGIALNMTAQALRVKGEWPAESQVSVWFYAQGALTCLAWLLLIAALIVSVYVRPAPFPPRNIEPWPQPLMQMPQPPPERPLRDRLGEFRERRQERREQRPVGPPPGEPPQGGPEPPPPGDGG